MWLAAALLACALPARAQEAYGAKGLFPVYETTGQWVIFDKRPDKRHPTPLGPGQTFLVIGTSGAELFVVKRDSGTYGGACRGHKPLRLRAGLLVGPRRKVGRPILGIHVPPSFSLKGSRAVFTPLSSQVSDATYQALGDALRQATLADVRSGAFKFKPDDATGRRFAADPKPEQIQTKIDFGAKLDVGGLKDPFVFIEETEIGASTRRCARLADGPRLVGGCAEMPLALMAETDLLQFVAYDPTGRGAPYLLALTKTTPLWGDERWGFAVRSTGPRLFLEDAMDIRCREGF